MPSLSVVSQTSVSRCAGIKVGVILRAGGFSNFALGSCERWFTGRSPRSFCHKADTSGEHVGLHEDYNQGFGGNIGSTVDVVGM